MRLSVVTPFCLDSESIARIGVSSMDQQTLMELLVSNMHGQNAFKNDAGDFLDISNWQDVYLDEGGRISKIDFEHDVGVQQVDDWLDDFDADIINIDAGGSTDLKWIPHSVVHFSLCALDLEGTIETKELPRGLAIFRISSNAFTGTFDMPHLPAGITTLYINNNRLHGTLNVNARLPLLKILHAQSNLFTGILDTSSLPDGIVDVDLRYNRFTEVIHPENKSENPRYFTSYLY